MPTEPTPKPPADTTAEAYYGSLVSGAEFPITLPDLSLPAYQLPATTGPLYDPIEQLHNPDLTTGVVGGTGTFDVLMASIKAHLRTEYEANRITGAEYTKAYIAMTESAISGAVQFLLGRDQARWQAVAAQAQAQIAQVQLVTARVGLETAKVQFQTVRLEGMVARASYALTKMKLATEGVSYDGAAYNLTYILPQQRILLEEQTEVQRSQTLDTRTDGSDVAGTVGKQKDLYSQQIVSYKRDSEVKVAKLFTDAWITQKTMDEGLLPPTNFANASLDVILAKLKLNTELV